MSFQERFTASVNKKRDGITIETTPPSTFVLVRMPENPSGFMKWLRDPNNFQQLRDKGTLQVTGDTLLLPRVVFSAFSHLAEKPH